MIGAIFAKIAGFYLSKLNNSSKIQDFLMWPMATRILGNKRSEPVKLKNGILMKTDLKDILGRFILFYGPYLDYFWEPQTVKLAEALLRDAKEIIIAGSHLGYFALMAKRAMQKEGRMHAFEPVSYLYEISKENFSLNKTLGEMVINKYGLSERNGEALIRVDSIRSAIVVGAEENTETEKIETITIDRYAEERGISRLDFVLLDVEGCELRVLRGMENLLKKGQPKDLIFEFSPQIKGGISETGSLFGFLRQFGYDLYIISDNYKLEKVSKDWGGPEIFKFEKNMDKFQGEKYFNVFATRRPAEELKELTAVCE